MEHKNKVIIDVLRGEYADYDVNTWHYDSEYKMIEKALSKVKNGETLANENHYCHCPTPALYTRIGENVSRCWIGLGQNWKLQI